MTRATVVCDLLLLPLLVMAQMRQNYVAAAIMRNRSPMLCLFCPRHMWGGGGNELGPPEKRDFDSRKSELKSLKGNQPHAIIAIIAIK